jgi:protein-S-isoprenylcysteine O-methyltransferase Ste14
MLNRFTSFVAGGVRFRITIHGLTPSTISAACSKEERDYSPDPSPQELVTEGIYARIRHPRYLSVLLGLVGLALMANYFGIYVVVAAFVPGLYAIIILEERELVERFGDAYRDYCKRVPRLIPRLHR